MSEKMSSTSIVTTASANLSLSSPTTAIACSSSQQRLSSSAVPTNRCASTTTTTSAPPPPPPIRPRVLPLGTNMKSTSCGAGRLISASSTTLNSSLRMRPSPTRPALLNGCSNSSGSESQHAIPPDPPTATVVRSSRKSNVIATSANQQPSSTTITTTTTGTVYGHRLSPTVELAINRRSLNASGLYPMTSTGVNDDSTCGFYQHRPDSPMVSPLMPTGGVISRNNTNCRHNTSSSSSSSMKKNRNSTIALPSSTTTSVGGARRAVVSAGVNTQLDSSGVESQNKSTAVVSTSNKMIVAPMNRRNSYGCVNNSTDHEPDGRRVTLLEQKVSDLEAAIRGGAVTTTPTSSFVIPISESMRASMSCPRIHPQFISFGGNNTNTAGDTKQHQQLLMQEIFEKDQEIEQLRHDVYKYRTRLEKRQMQFDDDLMHALKESEQSRVQLAAIKSRVNDLETECSVYKEKAIAVEQQRQCSLVQAQERLTAKEKEMQCVRQELEKLQHLVDDVANLRKDLEWMELQNESLNTALDCKEHEVMELNAALNEMKEQQASPSTVINNSSATIRTSNGTVRRQARISTCLYTVKCLLDTANRLARGEPPNLNKLLACPSESESEIMESISRNSVGASSNDVSMKSEDSKLATIERDLECLRQVFVDFHAKQMADQISDKPCRIQ